MAKRKENPKWLADPIQFPRLISEIHYVGLTDEQYDLLCESMDLTSDQLDELFDRALAVWEELKNDKTMLVPFHEYDCPFWRMGKKHGPCNCKEPHDKSVRHGNKRRVRVRPTARKGR